MARRCPSLPGLRGPRAHCSGSYRKARVESKAACLGAVGEALADLPPALGPDSVAASAGAFPDGARGSEGPAEGWAGGAAKVPPEKMTADIRKAIAIMGFNVKTIGNGSCRDGGSRMPCLFGKGAGPGGP